MANKPNKSMYHLLFDEYNGLCHIEQNQNIRIQ